MESLVQMNGVSKYYGSTAAMQDISLEIPPGRIVGLVGPNGAGKTTMLRALSGLISYKGEISVLGLEPNTHRSELMERTGIIHDVPVLPSWMKVHQLLKFQENMHPGFERSKCEQHLQSTSIGMTSKIKHLSKGMKTQLHLSLMLATESDILILDEPTHGLDIIFRKQFYNTVLEDYFDKRKSILVSTHQIEEVEHILSDVIFIQHGEILLYDSVDNLNNRYIQVTVSEEDLPGVRRYEPLSETNLIGRKVLLLEGVDPDEVRRFGKVTNPSLADIFVALMGGEA